MLENVLRDIHEAESKAEAMQKEAYQKGKEIVLNAEAEAEAQKKSTVQECKADRAKALRDSHRLAAERTQVILKNGENEANAFADSKNSAIEDCANEIVAILFEKYITE